ncbi:unnamed protein product [Phytomonas sp. EM1]|nr:unnamed protein product [Phytomonas sp. EM1]|eukprot:CCW64941.1 unnamed protein product [Phytomonas sp. isolate EM1]
MSNTSPSSALHPLLCLRVLERLGYAVYRRPTAAEGDPFDLPDPTASSATGSLSCSSRHSHSFSFSEDAMRSGGWLSRHMRLSLATSSLQLRNIVENVLVPLEGLMGDSSRNLKSHPQVAPVIHIALEWWCTLPYSLRLPADRWMPRLASFYSFRNAKLEQWDGGQGGESHVDFMAPPISFLMPYFMEKMRRINSYEAFSPQNNRNSGDVPSKKDCKKNISLMNPISEALVQLFTFFLLASPSINFQDGVRQPSTQGDNGVVNQKNLPMLMTYSRQHQVDQPILSNREVIPFTCSISCDGRSFTLPPITLRDPLLANVLFWQGTLPLLALPLVAGSLYMAAVSLASLRGSQPSRKEVKTNETVPSEVKGELPRGQRGDESVDEKDSCPNPPTSGEQLIYNCSITLQIPIHDDDTFRKLLLRLSSSVSEPVICEFSNSMCSKEKPRENAFFAYQVMSLIEPIVSLGHKAKDQEQTHPTNKNFHSLAPKIPIHDSFCTTTNKFSGMNGTVEVSIDTPLRWINPLHEYLIATYTERAACLASHFDKIKLQSDTQKPQRALSLSFTGVVNVLAAALERFELLRKESSCAAAAHRGYNSYDGSNASHTDAHSGSKAQLGHKEFKHPTRVSFTLLPEKQRVHAFKEACEMLLNHARRSLHHQQPLRRHSTRCGTIPDADDSNEGKQSSVVQWFPDVPVSQQEMVLRRMCGACRALVRVVMEEKRSSLVLEGPEGAAVNAGGASYSLPSEHNSPNGVQFVGDRPQQHSKTFAEVLRNTAFRILEPSLWRYYTECKEWEPQQLSMGDLQAMRCGWSPASQTLGEVTSAQRARAFIPLTLQSLAPATHAADLVYLSTIVNIDESWEPRLVSFCESIESVYSNIGGAAAWKTAVHILRNPLQQPLHAVVEGIRLVCLHILLFHSSDGIGKIHFGNYGPVFATGKGNACHGKSVKKPHGGGCGDEHVLLDVIQGFFCVWKHYSDAAGDEDPISAVSALSSPTAVVESASRSNDTGLGSMPERLLLLVYLTLQRYLLHNSDDETAYCRQYDLNVGHDSIHTAFRSLGALFPLQDCGATSERAMTASSDVAKPGRGPGGIREAEAALHIAKAHFPHAFHDFSSEKLARWELAEELREFVAATCTLRPLPDVATWHWVGTPAAVRRAMRTLKQLSASAEQAGATYYFLLPWSAWALSHHPLRLYDESGQSAGAAEEFEQGLQSFLESPSGVLEHDIARGEASPGARVVMRFVSAMEEIQHFAVLSGRGKRAQSVMFLADDIQVVNAEAALEEGLQAWKQYPAEARSGVDSMANQDEEGEYDGLD